MEKYSIGDFANYLGVTPDFLKYLEKKGIIKADISDKGFRSYDYRHAPVIIEYLKLKNQGYSANEISEILLGPNSFEMILERNSIMREKILRQRNYLDMLLQFYDVSAEIGPRMISERSWQLRRSTGFYYLGHIRGSGLVKEEQISSRIREWNKYLPAIGSTVRFSAEDFLRGDFHSKDKVWGYSAPEDVAKRLGLDVSEPVIYVPPVRMLFIYGFDRASEIESSLFGYAGELVEKLGERPSGDVYYLANVSAGPVEDRMYYGVLAIELSE